jgi:hypothetical protein
MLAARLLSMVLPSLLSAHVLVSVETLSLLADTEDFQTHRQQYIRSVDDVTLLLSLRASCLVPLQSEMDKRKLVRPLIDAIDRAKRQYRLK